MTITTPIGKVTVTYRPIEGMNGYWDKAIREIGIHDTLPQEEKDEVLLHELGHLVEDVLKAQGKLKRGIVHDYLNHGSHYLADFLKQAGVWK